MSPALATILCVLFITWALWRQRRERPDFDSALWIPLIWLILLASRPLSFWLSPGSMTGGSQLEGNAIDRNLYLVLAAFAILILNRRGVRWDVLIRDNFALCLFYLYLLVTICWAEYPFVSFKRWFKDLCAVFVLLVILSDYRPREAMLTVFSKCAIVLFSLSVVFIKYIPELGRYQSPHGGNPQIIGVTDQKNALGELVMICGLILIWELIQRWRELPAGSRLKNTYLSILVLALGFWILSQSDSKTATLCLLAGSVILLSNTLPIARQSPKLFVGIAVTALATLIFLEDILNLKAAGLKLIGRDETFTGRTAIWEALKQHPVDELFGSGYLMYWDVTGPIMIDGYPATLKTAHNGYLEIYLDGGMIGVGFLIVMLVAAGRKAIQEFLTGSDFGRLKLAIFTVMVIYNFSESTFARRGIMWFSFLMICADYRRVFPQRHFYESLDVDSEVNADEALPEFNARTT